MSVWRLSVHLKIDGHLRDELLMARDEVAGWAEVPGQQLLDGVDGMVRNALQYRAQGGLGIKVV